MPNKVILVGALQVRKSISQIDTLSLALAMRHSKTARISHYSGRTTSGSNNQEKKVDVERVENFREADEIDIGKHGI